MPDYIINETEDNRGYHEVHETTCSHLPYSWNQEKLGWFSSCSGAVTAAKAKHPSWKVDGCYYCSESCHNY